MLKFTKLRLKNWKNFKSVEVDLQNRMFLVGPNASGKSNLLDAFRFLRDLSPSGGGFRDAIHLRGGMNTIRCLAARKKPDIEICVEVRGNGGNRWKYELTFHQDQQRRPKVRKERILRDDETIIDRPGDDDRKDTERLTQTYLDRKSVV